MEKGNELFNEAIKVLNEKGYHVVEASNGSDVKDSYYKDEVMSKERYDFEMNEGNPEIQVIKEDNDGDLIVRRYNRGNPVKVLFDKRYDVELPQGFHFAGTSEGNGFKYDIITTKIDDNGNVVGLADLDDTCIKIENRINTTINPQAIFLLIETIVPEKWKMITKGQLKT